MGAATAILSGILFLGQLLPVDPGIHPDDFISVSCPDRRSCLILDNAGNVWFAPGGGARLIRRSNQKRIGLAKIVFNGLIDGWGLDRKGGLWRTRNGGRSFLSVPLPGGSPGVDIRGKKEVWLGVRDGSLFRLRRKKNAAAVAKVSGANALDLFDFNQKGLIAAAAADGSVLVSRDRGSKWTRTRPLAGKITGLLVDAGGRIVVSGCRGAVALSADSGGTFKGLKLPETPGSWSSVCVSPGGFLQDGRFLLLGIPGNALIGRPDSGILTNLPIPPQRNWRDAALLRGSESLLVGNGGARVRLKALRDREPECTPLGKSRSTVTGTQVLKRGRAWVAFMDGQIRHSADGGRNWKALAPPAVDQPVRISFVDVKNGFALTGHHRLLGTTDGGRTWNLLGDWPDAFFNDLCFADRQHGWAVGKIGCVVRTTDGGKNWTLDRLPTDRDLNRIQFVDRNRGWAVGDKQGVFRTQDGGRSWSRMLSGRGSLYDLHFEPSGEGWICGDAGIVLHTKDGGESWTPRPTPTNKTLRAMSFLGQSRGLAGGDGGGVFLTKDGGNSWKPLDLSTAVRVVTIACDRRSSHCLVGGDRGLLLMGNPFRFHR